MAPSQASFQDLIAQTSAAKDTIRRSKDSKRESKKTGGVDWLKQNKGVNKRAQRDVELRENNIARLSHEQMKANMEKKSRQYEQMKRGDYSNVSEALQAELPFDPEGRHHYPSDEEEDVDESCFVPEREDSEEEDPIIPYIDEFGRQREGRRSEIPTEYHPKPSFIQHEDDSSDDGEYMEGAAAAHHFETYEPTADRLAAIKESLKDVPAEQYFDPNRDIRDRAALYMDLGRTEEERKRNMAALDEIRQETLRARAEAGAIDLKPGQVEGMTADDKPRNSALEKRKRERDARLVLVQAKKRKYEANAFLTDILGSGSSS